MTININGKEYDETKFDDILKNYIIARQEIQNSRIRMVMELEKIDVLTNYYNVKINEELKKLEEPKENNKE
jgi:hypothetical protein